MEHTGVGIIGAGAISGAYIKSIQDKFPWLELRAISARSLASAQAKAEEFGLEACTTDELLAREDVALVIVLTPVGSHYDLVRAALEADKHVYSEKTLTDDHETACELAKLAHERGLMLGCAPDTFLGSALQTTRKTLDDGALGEVTGFSATINRDNQLLVSLFPFLTQPGAGAIHDYAVYYLTALVSLLGPVAEVAAFSQVPAAPYVSMGIGKTPTGEPIECPNEARVAAILRMESGVFGTLLIDNDSLPADHADFQVLGTDGILHLSDPNQFGGTVTLERKSYDFANLPQPEALEPVLPEYATESRGLGAADLALAIAEDREPRASAELACHVLEVCDAILKSASAGSFVQIESTCKQPAAM